MNKASGPKIVSRITHLKKKKKKEGYKPSTIQLKRESIA